VPGRGKNTEQGDCKEAGPRVRVAAELEAGEEGGNAAGWTNGKTGGEICENANVRRESSSRINAMEELRDSSIGIKASAQKGRLGQSVRRTKECRCGWLRNSRSYSATSRSGRG